MMFKIGKDLVINGKVVLGPMAGITSCSYREFMKPFGVSLSFTEMVSDCGIIYHNEETWSYLNVSNSDRPLGLQLFGSSPETIKKAVIEIKDELHKFDLIDINMGCPVPKVTRSGAGSALMKDPKKCGDIIKAIKEVTDLPVSAKIRLGWDDKSINFLEVISELEKAGVDLISIHARTTKQLYSGEPRYNLLKDLRKKMNVPLVISGNIYTLDDAINALKITGADAVMVARGGIGNPQLVRQIETFFETGERIKDASLEEQKRYCLSLAEMISKEKGEDRGIKIFRSIGPKFFSGFSNSKQIRNKISMEAKTVEDIRAALKEFN